ncbi:MAG TPA: sugar transferase [Verrucomicrobiae bacterium]|nr:sugar transferase [Verrucomicrobiae bacterium]
MIASRIKNFPLWKRALDLAAVGLSAPCWIPLSVLIGLSVKIASPGPAFFRQTRVGYHGRPFLCLKFRTMNVSADTGIHHRHLAHLIKSDEPMTKLDARDSRLIHGGRLLRALGLDELPQLLNVLRGEMSLVGPRPCLEYEYEQFSQRHRERFETLPGLTGLWQVSGKNRTTFEQMMNLDIRYVREKSLWLDLKILAKTIPAILIQVYETKFQKHLSRIASQKIFRAVEK